MAVTAPARTGATTSLWRATGRTASIGLAVALGLMAAAIVVPAAFHWDVQVDTPPLVASWMPRVGPGTLVALPLAVVGVRCLDLAERLPWRRLLLVGWLVALTWLASLALVDVQTGRASYPDVRELVATAAHTSNIAHLLHDYVARIPLGPHGWVTHVAGHPPGALLFFVVLAHIGLGGGIAAGVVVTVVASTIPVAVLVTLRDLGAESSARLVAPFLVLGPAAIWESVSADAVYAAVVAWGLAALAHAAVRRSPTWSVVAGLLFGTAILMSYGLPLAGLLALAVLVAAGSFRPIPWTLAATLAVVVAFALAGFSLLDAYPAIHQRYWAGIASLRPASYWLWGDLAALCFSAGPVLGAVVACWWSGLRPMIASKGAVLGDHRAAWLLGGGAMLAVVLADVSLMSKAEVERIWLPFVPWLLVLCALLPPSWRRPMLAVQVICALLVQHLLVTAW